MQRKLILVDIDGTLVGDTRRIPGDAVLAVKAAQSNGHLVMICTGRASGEVEGHILSCGFDGLLAASGAYIEIGGEVYSERFVEPSVVTDVTAALDQLGVDYLWQSSKGMWGTPRYLEKLLVVKRFDSPEERDRWHDIDESRKLARERGCDIGDVVPASKGTFLVPDGSPVTVASVREVLHGAMTVINGSMGSFAKVNGELMIPGVNKGTALLDVADRLGIPLEDTIAIGDSDNDLAMLRMAGTAVAMGNGTDSVKAVADKVTGDVNRGGLLNAFTELRLI